MTNYGDNGSVCYSDIQSYFYLSESTINISYYISMNEPSDLPLGGHCTPPLIKISIFIFYNTLLVKEFHSESF